MSYSLCMQCLLSGFCHKLKSIQVSDRELANTHFVRDVKGFAANLNVSPYDWREYLSDLYRDYKGRILDDDGNEIFLDTEVFEFVHFREWIRDFTTLVPVHVTPRVRKEAKERVRIIATILRARFPRESMMWGVRAANDN